MDVSEIVALYNECAAYFLPFTIVFGCVTLLLQRFCVRPSAESLTLGVGNNAG